MTPAALALPISALITLVLIHRNSWPCFRVEPFPSPLRRGLAIALLVLVLALASVGPLIAFETASASDPLPGDLRFSSLFLGHALLGGFLLLWWILADRPPVERFLALRVEREQLSSELQIGAAGGAAAWAITMTVMSVVGLALGGIDAAALEEEPRGEIPEVVRWIVALTVMQRFALIVSAGVVEELFFRSFLQMRCGILISSLFFMASHASYGLPLMLVGVFTVSLVLGWIFRVRGNVLPCIVAHGVFDAIQLYLILPVVVGGGAL